MRSYFLVALLLIGVCSGLGYGQSLGDDQISKEWENYKAEHNKSYSPSEEIKRLNIFKKHMKLIEEHNDKFRRGEATYHLKINHLADMEEHEFNNMLSYTKHERPDKSMYLIMSASEAINLPPSFDWREKNAVSKPKQQGSNCGACWSFSATGALESQYYIKTGNMTLFSEQYMVDCSRQNHGCGGGNAYYAFDFCKQHGVVREKAYPYEGKDGYCRQAKKFRDLKVKQIIAINPSETELRAALIRHGPVTVAVDASGTLFQFYSGGIYRNPYCYTDNPNHAMLVVGYGSENGIDYWIVKNSWGTKWGMDGYVKMVRTKFEDPNISDCGITYMPILPLIETFGIPDDDNGSLSVTPALVTLFVSTILSILV